MSDQRQTGYNAGRCRMADTVATIAVGPEDHGRRMPFADFQKAEPATGHVYELARGVVEVTDIPNRTHAQVVNEIKRQLAAYWTEHPEVITFLSAGSESKIEMPGLESERHPDLSIYLTPMPDDEYPWDKWLPAIVVEVVSPGAEAHRRDYQIKRDEYLAAGIQEYWIVDPQERRMLALTRHGDRWREHRLAADAAHRTSLLPGLSLRLSAVFAPLKGA